MADSRPSKDRASVAPDGQIYAIPTEADIRTSYARIAGRAEWYRQQGRQVVVVQGLGFVGAAVAAVVAAARNSLDEPLFFVVGVDLPDANSYWKVAQLNSGLTPVRSPDSELDTLIDLAVKKHRNLVATVSEQTYALADVIVVDVPLDVQDRSVQSPESIDIDLHSFEMAIRSIGHYMRPEALVLIETTVPAGICERIVAPILAEERAQRNIRAPLYLAHAYERVMPGRNYVNSIRRYWRTFSGINEASAAKARDFLSSYIQTESYPLSELENTTSSELAKLLENSYRAVNIAFIHEWTLLAEQMGLNLFSVIDSIRVRQGTHDNMRLPGFGVGGYCLTKDSLLAQWSATQLFESDLVLKMTLEAIRINFAMPLHTLKLLTELAGGELCGKNVAVLGVSYLPEVADTRNSPTELLVDELVEAGATVMIHDPHVLTWPERPALSVSQDLAECLSPADGIVLAVPHCVYQDLQPQTLLGFVPAPPFIVDAQNVISDEKAKMLHEAGCRLLGVGKGHWRKYEYQWQR